jgi:hypothetical protein
MFDKNSEYQIFINLKQTSNFLIKNFKSSKIENIIFWIIISSLTFLIIIISICVCYSQRRNYIEEEDEDEEESINSYSRFN